jgi:hypothetical protein
LEGQHRGAAFEYIEKRWRQLGDLEKDGATEALKFLFLVNSGALAGTLAFTGAVHRSAVPLNLVIALSAFFLGLVAVGIVHAGRYFRYRWLYKSFQADARAFFGDGLSWQGMLDNDQRRSYGKAWAWLNALCLISFLAFITGAGAGLRQLL